VTESARGPSYEAFGDYVRSQRKLAQLSLRQAAELARISNPYLSQIEHGLALPSVTVLSALAEALQVSADALLLRAAGVATGDTTATSTEAAIRHDQRLDDVQKKALLAVLTAFVGTRPARPARVAEGATAAAPSAPRRRRPPTAPTQRKRVPRS
jgi:transcriptional regulator with XRE-family HTH domain